jgi:hypothetical protein
LTILDYDWRFRLPLLPQMIFLAACGVDALAVRLGVLERAGDGVVSHRAEANGA